MCVPLGDVFFISFRHIATPSVGFTTTHDIIKSNSITIKSHSWHHQVPLMTSSSPHHATIKSHLHINYLSQLSTSQVELLKLLNSPVVQKLTVLLLFTKSLSPLAIDISRIYNIFNFDGILANSVAPVKVFVVYIFISCSLELIQIFKNFPTSNSI